MEDIRNRVVDGFCFANAEEAEQAKKEWEGILYIKGKIEEKEPEKMLQIYNKMIEQELFETAVGYSYLKEVQKYLLTIPFIQEEDIFPIPVTHPKLEQSLNQKKIQNEEQSKKDLAENTQEENKKMLKLKQKKQSRHLKSEQLQKRLIQWNVVLVLCVIGMFLITFFNDSPTIVNYQSKLLDRYASWEQELTEREAAVQEKEQQLGIEREGKK